jgi:hypothetical protein
MNLLLTGFIVAAFLSGISLIDKVYSIRTENGSWKKYIVPVLLFIGTTVAAGATYYSGLKSERSAEENLHKADSATALILSKNDTIKTLLNRELKKSEIINDLLRDQLTESKELNNVLLENKAISKEMYNQATFAGSKPVLLVSVIPKDDQSIYFRFNRISFGIQAIGKYPVSGIKVRFLDDVIFNSYFRKYHLPEVYQPYNIKAIDSLYQAYREFNDPNAALPEKHPFVRSFEFDQLPKAPGQFLFFQVDVPRDLGTFFYTVDMFWNFKHYTFNISFGWVGDKLVVLKEERSELSY